MEQKANDKAERNQQMLERGKKLYARELIKQISTLEQLMTALGNEFRNEDAQHVYRIAHQMKGSAPIFGFERAGRVAEELAGLWDWSLDGGSHHRFADILEESQGPLTELKMEYELCRREIEYEEHGGDEAAHPKFQGRLLVIDDDNLLRTYLVAQFERDQYQVDEASDVETAKRKLRESTYDVILLDLMMYPQSGYDLFEFLKEDATLKWIPLIVLSGREDLEDKVRCLRLGADDYVTKPFQYEELEARIASILKRSREYEQMAFRDALTGVFNRRYFDHHLQMVLSWNLRNPKPISLVFIDIDRFKLVNDTYGHHVGDLVLQGLGHMLAKNLRTTDVLARYGGEELVILLTDTDREQAVFVMERILARVRKQPMARYEGQEVFVTFSAGIAQWLPGMTAAQWLMLADGAMYRAKQTGRDRVLASSEEEWADIEWKPARTQLRKRLLIIDDDEMIRSMIRGKLLDLPVDIFEASDGDEAMQMLKDHPADLCILDGIMPRVDGLIVLEKIRRDPQLRNVKVLMLSSRKAEEDVVLGLSLGADDYVRKPFSLLELELRVKKLLDLD